MPLAQAIQFKFLAAQLTSSETISFIQNVVDSDPKMIIDALSLYFMHRLPINENTVQHDRCIETISTIIQSRDSQPEEQDCNKIDDLPTGIIGLCGSFLDQDSYGQLSNVNRAIYLGCNSPNTLRELEVEYQFPSDHQSLDFSVFPFARELTLRMNFIDRHGPYISTGRMKLIASQIANMSRLEALHLPGVS